LRHGVYSLRSLQIGGVDGSLRHGVYSLRSLQIGGEPHFILALKDITERKETEEKFVKVFMTVPEPITISRLTDGMFVDVNAKFEENSGWTRDEVVGRTSLELGLWTDQSDRAYIIRELKAGRDIVDREIRFRRKDGAVRCCICSSRSIQLAGEPHIIMTMNDVTEMKETERKLRENEERLHSIIDNMPGSICQFYAKDSGEQGMSYVSGRLTELLGLSDGGDTTFPMLLEHIHEEDRDRFLTSVREAVASAGTWNFEGRCVTVSGSVIWFYGRSTPIRLGDRLVYNAILFDITDRKLAEQKAAETEMRYTSLVDSLPDAVVMTDAEGRVKFFSSQAAKLYGIDTPESAIGQPIMDIVAPESLEKAIRNRQLLHEGATLPPQEYIVRRLDGSTFEAEIFHSVVRNASGGVESVVSVVRDVSEKKRLERERIELERVLSHSQKMDAIGQLAGGVAHDFNNILMGIQGNASLMRMGYHPEHPNYLKLKQIEEHVERGANLTRQLLGFAREGKYEVAIVSINDLVRKMAQLFLTTHKEIDVGLQLQDDLPQVEADVGQIEQVLLNIFINAGHAMPRGGQLYVRTDNVTLAETDARICDTAPGDYVKVSITDTGTGMDAQVLKRIFEPFFTTKAAEGGSGLGLASAYGIIRNHGGIIKAYSELGHGSTFSIYLPSSRKQAAEKKRSYPPNLIPGTGGILLVDDESLILNATSEILQLLGYTVYQAESGQEAVDVYREKQGAIDVVILDMILPGMSGSEVLKILKEMNPDVRVILSSGYSLRGEVQKVMESGCRDFIQKPYVLAELTQMLHRLLSDGETA
jgi:PAS domain S-box-containing protein